MSINNDIKRLRKYLDVFTVEGSEKVFFDIIKMTRGMSDPKKVVKLVRDEYVEKLQKLLDKRESNFIQVKIDF